MTKIRSVTARSLAVPLLVPVAFSTRSVTSRHYCVVRVAIDDGSEGWGFTYEGSQDAGLVARAVDRLLAPVIVDQDPHRTEGLWQQMYEEALLQGRSGAVMRAISAIDIALWDRNAKAASLPLWRYLGSVASKSVPAYASGGYYVEGKGLQELASEAEHYVTNGFKGVKIKVGRVDPDVDEQRVAAVREAVGPDVLLMLDANNAWKDIPSALLFVRRFEKYQPFWIEEPFGPDDLLNHSRLANMTSIPIATGEIESARWRHLEWLRHSATAILQTDAVACGGITEFRRIAATASSFGVPVWPHAYHDLHVHLVASIPNAGWVEYFTDTSVLNFSALLDRELTRGYGELILPNEPGLGFGFNVAAIEEFELKRD